MTQDHLDLLRLPSAARDACREMLEAPIDSEVQGALNSLRARLGVLTEKPQLPEYPESVWTAGLLRFVPELLDWYRARGVPEDVIADSLPDWGRHFALHRRVHGAFGLETWRWLVAHAQGTMFQLGRLQFMLYRPDPALPDGEGTYALGIHIPETSEPLDPDAVDASIERARAFFPVHFPEVLPTFATCDSWMLDPGLRSELPDTSNVARFADRFTHLGRQGAEPTDALYFVFRTRDTNSLASLPRASSVQRAVLDRYAAGTPVLGTAGYFRL
ncbi:hypothetical protein GCM10027403_24860 [Arthrobacter tecti]